MVLRILFISVFLFIVLSAFSQAHFSAGVNAFYYSTKLDLPERSYHGLGEIETDPSFSGGIFFQIHLGDHFLFRSEINTYATTLTSDSVNVVPVGDLSKYTAVRFDYSTLEFPIMGIYRIRNAPIQPFIGGGFSIGINTKTDFSEESFGFIRFDGQNTYSPVTYEWDRTNTGFLALLGINVKLNEKLAISAEGRFISNDTSVDIKRFGTNTDGYGLGTNNFKTNRIQIGVGLGYKF